MLTIYRFVVGDGGSSMLGTVVCVTEKRSFGGWGELDQKVVES